MRHECLSFAVVFRSVRLSLTFFFTITPNISTKIFDHFVLNSMQTLRPWYKVHDAFFRRNYTRQVCRDIVSK